MVKGDRKIQGSVAYVEQDPFIISDTLRANILFGQEYDQQKFERVLKASQMDKDLQLFGYGIYTAIGERGVDLSGGQKARISLARALYADADIILLDDPLSAVDTKVARRIFDECIRGMLKNKIVVLVTHQLQFLQECENILLISDDGKVGAKGNLR